MLSLGLGTYLNDSSFKIRDCVFFEDMSATCKLVINAYGQEQSSDIKQTIDEQTTQLLKSCSELFDTGITHGYSVNFCADFFDMVDHKCQNTYKDYCFGMNWINYDTVHKKQITKNLRD
jgi:hypothetical protein